MKVRIIKHLPRQLEGINLARFELGGVYEAGGAVLDLLIVSGYAVPAEDAIKPNRKEAIKSLADARIAAPPRGEAFGSIRVNGQGPAIHDTRTF